MIIQFYWLVWVSVFCCFVGAKISCQWLIYLLIYIILYLSYIELIRWVWQSLGLMVHLHFWAFASLRFFSSGTAPGALVLSHPCVSRHSLLLPWLCVTWRDKKNGNETLPIQSYIIYIPQKTNMEPENTPWKGRNMSKPPILGSMLIFGGVVRNLSSNELIQIGEIIICPRFLCANTGNDVKTSKTS